MKGPHVLRYAPNGEYKARKGLSRRETTPDLTDAQIWKGSGPAHNARPPMRNLSYRVGDPSANPDYYSYYVADSLWEVVPVRVSVEVAG